MFDGFHVPYWLWWILGFAAIFGAQFRVYHGVRKERDAIRRYNIKQDKLEQLSLFRNDFVSFQNDKMNSEVEFGSWKQRYEDKRKEVIVYIAENLTPAEANIFERIGDYATVLITGKKYISVEHFNLVAQTIRDHRWLDKAIQDYGRQRFRPEVEQEPTTEGGS